MASQLEAVMGKKIKPSRTSELAARAALLPSFYRDREALDRSREELDLSRDALAANMAYQEKSLAANEAAARDALKIDKAKLGASALLGLGGFRESLFGGGSDSPAGAPAALAPAVASPVASAGTAVGTSVDGTLTRIPFKVKTDGFSMPSLQNMAGAALGGYAGYKLGGDSTLGKVAGATGGALLGDALTGGTLYKDVGNIVQTGISTVWNLGKSLFGF